MVYVGIRTSDLRDMRLGYAFSVDKYSDRHGSAFEQVIANGYNYKSDEDAFRAATGWLNENHGVYWDLV